MKRKNQLNHNPSFDCPEVIQKAFQELRVLSKRKCQTKQSQHNSSFKILSNKNNQNRTVSHQNLHNKTTLFYFSMYKPNNHKANLKSKERSTNKIVNKKMTRILKPIQNYSYQYQPFNGTMRIGYQNNEPVFQRMHKQTKKQLRSLYYCESKKLLEQYPKMVKNMTQELSNETIMMFENFLKKINYFHQVQVEAIFRDNNTFQLYD